MRRTQSEFVVGVMGTSVTAGHDNYYNQSFPVVWGRIMEEAFTAANTTLIMRNHAMGWNPIHPRYAQDERRNPCRLNEAPGFPPLVHPLAYTAYLPRNHPKTATTAWGRLRARTRTSRCGSSA